MSKHFTIPLVVLGILIATAGASHPVHFDVKLLTVDNNDINGVRCFFR